MGMPSHLATESGWCASPRHRVFSPPERRAELVEGLILPKWLAAGFAEGEFVVPVGTPELFPLLRFAANRRCW